MDLTFGCQVSRQEEKGRTRRADGSAAQYLLETLKPSGLLQCDSLPEVSSVHGRPFEAVIFASNDNRIPLLHTGLSLEFAGLLIQVNHVPAWSLSVSHIPHLACA